MNPDVLAAAKTFLRDLYQAKNGKVPTDAELHEFCLQDWSQARTLVPRGTTPGQALARLTQDFTEFPGMSGGQS